MKLIYLTLTDLVLPFFSIPARLIMLLVPKDPRLFVFGSWMGKNFSDNPKFFYRYLKEQHSDFKLVIVTNNKINQRDFKQKGVRCYSKYSLQALFFVARSKVLFTTHSVKSDLNFLTVSPSNKVVQFWHGTPVKKLTNLGYLKSKRNRTLLSLYKICLKFSNFLIPEPSLTVSASIFGSEKLTEFFKDIDPKVEILGYPRNDILLTAPQKKFNILYLPTYRMNSSQNISQIIDLVKLNELLVSKNYDFVIKLHPAAKGDVELSKYSNIFEFVDYYGTTDAQEGMAQSHVLVSDYSGIIYDYFLTNRPLIFFIYDIEQYNDFPGFYFDYLREFPGPFAFASADLVSLIDNINVWSNKQEYMLKYKMFKNKFNYFQDSESSRRVFEHIKENIL